MIVHGELDELFVVENATLLARAAREPKVVSIDPGVHYTRLYASDPEAYVKRLGAFFGAALQPTRDIIATGTIEATQ